MCSGASRSTRMLLLGIRDVPGLNVGDETGYPEDISP
jgi:hypothetical protein